jgi:hypothetical protein
MTGSSRFEVAYDAEQAAENILEALGGRRIAIAWIVTVLTAARRGLRDERSVGIVRGPAGAGHPVGYFSLVCVTCGATWTGEEGEPCGWCEDWLAAADARAERLRNRT